MFRFAVRVLLSAFVFVYVLPDISGAHFNGQFWPDGIVYGLLMAVVAYLFSRLIIGFIFGTLGIGLLFIIPALLFGFWLIPAIELQTIAHFFPRNLSFDGWHSAIIAGLVFLLVNAVTSVSKKSTTSTTKRS